MFTLQEYNKKLEYYCAYQERCHQEVKQKLYQLKCPTHWHDEVVVHLIHQNYLNESRFAHWYTISKWHQKKWGKLKILSALRQKNIPDNLINQALNDISQEDYLHYIHQQIKKISNEIIEDNQAKKKQIILQKMTQKGFEANLVLDILNSI